MKLLYPENIMLQLIEEPFDKIRLSLDDWNKSSTQEEYDFLPFTCFRLFYEVVVK